MFVPCVLTLLAFLFLGGDACPDPLMKQLGRRCYFASSEKKSFRQARQICKAMHAKLVSFESHHELAVVVREMLNETRKHTYWTSAKFADNKWKWASKADKKVKDNAEKAEIQPKFWCPEKIGENKNAIIAHEKGKNWCLRPVAAFTKNYFICESGRGKGEKNTDKDE